MRSYKQNYTLSNLSLTRSESRLEPSRRIRRVYVKDMTRCGGTFVEESQFDAQRESRADTFPACRV